MGVNAHPPATILPSRCGIGGATLGILRLDPHPVNMPAPPTMKDDTDGL